MVLGGTDLVDADDYSEVPMSEGCHRGLLSGLCGRKIMLWSDLSVIINIMVM